MSGEPSQIADTQPSLDQPKRDYIITTPITKSQLIPITSDARVNNLDIDVYHNTRDNWIKVKSFYQCNCGRYIGHYFQHNLPKPVNQEIEREAPPSSSVQSTVPPSGDESIISISSTTSSNLLVELYREPADFGSVTYNTTIQSSTPSDEHMSIDQSDHSIEAQF